MADVHIDSGFDFASSAFLNGAGAGTATQPVEQSVSFTMDAPAVQFSGQQGQQVQQQGGGFVEAPYVGQGFNLDEAVSGEMAEMTARRQEAAPQTQAAQPTASPVVQQRQQDGTTARQEQNNKVVSGMAPQEQVRPNQPVVPQLQRQAVEASQASQQPIDDTSNQPGVPMLALPSNDLDVESERPLHETVDDAYDSGNPLVQSAVESAIMRESSNGSFDPATVGRVAESDAVSRRANSADRALARENVTDNEKKPWWTKPVERLQRFSQNIQLRQQSVIDAAKSRAARKFKREGRGNRIYGKMFGLSTLDFQEVGVGIQEMLAAIRQNSTMLESLVSQYVDEVPSFGMMSSRKIKEFFDNNEIWVATFKPPNNQGQDTQRRRLRVLTQQQRGIYLHNTMAAMYTADYDGDDMEVSFDPSVARYAKDPMDYMVDIYGNISLNMDFMAVASIVPLENMDEWHYVRDVMLGDFTLKDDGTHIDRRLVSPLVNAILELGETANSGDDAQAKAYGKVFREARRFADRVNRGNVEKSNKMMSGICRAIFDSMQRTKYYNTLTVVGGDILTIDEDAVPEPVTYGDAIAYKIIDGMVKGKLPNNFQELKLLLTGFTGNVDKKNAPFRFTADVGKMMKMDERLMVGDHYELDVNDDMRMELFFKTTVKFAGSLKMAREIKKAGRVRYYTQVLRESVIRDVGFPEKYDTFQEFLNKFVRSYNKHSAIINEANLVFLTNMGLSSEPSGIVSPLKKTGKNDYTLGDLAEPMLSIYGTYSVGRIFNKLRTSGVMKRGNRDQKFAGNSASKSRDPNRWSEREFDFRYKANFWITGKYIDYNLRQFRNENRILSHPDAGLDDKKDSRGNVTKVGIRNTTIGSLSNDIDAQFDMLLAIADKKTGVMSTFNKATFGTMEGRHRSNEKTTVRYMSTLLTTVSSALREGNEVIAPGYYAGIGNRKIPEAVGPHMTNVAKRLANMGWVLRSGDAKGSDQSFQIGAGKAASIYKASSEDEVSKTASGFVMSLDKMTEAERKAAYDSVARLHPNGSNLDEKTRNLMARNYFQVIGTGGAIDSAFIACYADKESRGTWQAIRIARERGIPVFNAAEYQDLQQWEEDVIDAATKANMGQLRTDSISRDQALQVEDAINALIMANPDLFMHFNMDSPAAFLESSYGKKMLQYANDVEMLGGIYTSMVFDYRMERINSLSAEFLSLNSTELLEQAWQDLLFAKDELASASQVWHGILMEFEAEATDGVRSFFDMMREGNVTQKSEDGFLYQWQARKDAKEFWKNPGEHSSLRSVIEDLDLDRRTKWNVIADVVRYWEKDAYIKSYEIGYQLEVCNDSTYSMNSSPKAAMAIHKDFEQAFNSWGKRSQTALREDIERAKVGYSNVPNALTDTIRRLDQEPWELVSIDPMMYADAILSVYDKTYAQTEKASQNPWTNSIYAALSYQQVGGYMNDVQRTDDRLLGLTSVESVTIQDIIHLLANPDEDMVVYGRRGEYGIISRDILLQNELGELSGDIEADMWEFLIREPRIASAIRRHSACVMQNSEGKGYLGASNSITETIEVMSNGESNPIEHTKYLMRDHPGYAGIISLALPGKGLVTRNARHRVKQIEDFLSYEIYAAASSDWSSPAISEVILNDLGITQESLRSAMRSDYDTFLEIQGLEAYKYTVTDKNGNEILESDYDADQTYEYALECMTNYVDELREEARNGHLVLGRYMKEPADPQLGGPDAVSAAAFWDTIQELSGAKTAVSTGIEGSETYKFAEWVSHIRARDGYANLQAVMAQNEIDGKKFSPEWNGAWTNVIAEDGGPITLEVDTNGNVANAELIEQIAREQEINEIIVEVPIVDGEKQRIQDRSTDTHGNQVASLFAYMVSKRSNGAEAFNLKAKKAGIDHKDSITKKLRGGKHRVDENGKETNFIDLTIRFNDIAQKNGIRAAHMELAKMMLEENREIGYEDLTLANYMSIAELMLIERTDEDGNDSVHLRSLEMLISAIKYRIGFKVDEMSDKQLFDAVNEIVNDNSETGVGIAMMESLDALDGFSPRTRSAQHNAIRQSSSIFSRNYDLLSQITENAKTKFNVEPLPTNEAENLNIKLSRIVASDLDERSSNDTSKGVISFLNGYNITRIIGYGQDIDQGSWAIGPSNVLYIGPNQGVGSDSIVRACRKAYSLGMTIVCDDENYGYLPDFIKKTAVPMLDDDGNDLGPVLVPCFDARQNGTEAKPYKGRFAIAQVDFSKYVASAEDSTNEFGLGDAEGQALRHLTDNMSIVQSDTEKITAESLFPNVFKNKAYRDCNFRVGIASGETVRNLIAEGVRCTIDYGIVEGENNGFKQRKKDVDDAIERYRKRWSLANPDGLMMGLDDCKPGDIVGWAECEIRYPDGSCQYVLAPVIPFPLHGVKRQPSNYSVENFGPIDKDNTIFAVDWKNQTEVTDEFVKYFDSSGGANKGMISLTQALDESRTLLDGTPLDIYIAKASTDSRKVGTDRRIKTMISLMTLARIHGYNFARKSDGTPNEDAFPENPEVREKMLTERISTTEWKSLLGGNIRFTSDDTLNAFIHYECRKMLENGGNPSDYLANVYENDNGELENTHVMWEFEAMFDQGLNYEDGLLRFLSFVNPITPNEHVQKFCPNGIEDDSNDCLFHLYQENGKIAEGYDRGVLQMRVPHRINDKVAYVWDNVYIGLSFFGEEYSGFSRPNVDGASNFLDAMNTMSMYGNRLDGASERSRVEWATSDIGRYPHGNGSLGRI